MNGLSFAAVAFAPIFLAASAASADVVYGPTFSVKRCLDDAVDVIEAPRSIVALSDASAGSADASSRRLAQPRSTPERTREKAAGSRASAYVSASRDRSVSPSANATRPSGTGPTRATVR